MIIWSSKQISKYFVFHISKINRRKTAIFSMLLPARTLCKDVFVAVLYCVFTTTQTALNNGSLKSLPLWKMAGYHIGNHG